MYIEDKICTYEKTYDELRALTKAANVSPIIRVIKNLLDENMTFVDHGDESVTISVKLSKPASMFRNIIHGTINVHVYTSRFFFSSGKETVKHIKNPSSSSQFSFGKGHTVHYLFGKAVPYLVFEQHFRLIVQSYGITCHLVLV